jgi:hypothetical protein
LPSTSCCSLRRFRARSRLTFGSCASSRRHADDGPARRALRTGWRQGRRLERDDARDDDAGGAARALESDPPSSCRMRSVADPFDLPSAGPLLRSLGRPLHLPSVDLSSVPRSAVASPSSPRPDLTRLRLPTADLPLPTAVLGPPTFDYCPSTSDFRLSIFDSRPPTLDGRPSTSDPRPRLDLRPSTSLRGRHR